MATLIHQRVQLAHEGKNPLVICRMPSGWVVLGDIQVTRGYAVLLPDPVVADLNTLTIEDRLTYLRDMSVIGDALLDVTGAVRINYEIQGNAEPALHAHIVPRYANEPDEQRRRPIWFSDRSKAPNLIPSAIRN